MRLTLQRKRRTLSSLLLHTTLSETVESFRPHRARELFSTRLFSAVVRRIDGTSRRVEHFATTNRAAGTSTSSLSVRVQRRVEERVRVELEASVRVTVTAGGFFDFFPLSLSLGSRGRGRLVRSTVERSLRWMRSDELRDWKVQVVMVERMMLGEEVVVGVERVVVAILLDILIRYLKDWVEIRSAS